MTRSTQRGKGPRFYTTEKSPARSLGEIVALLTEYGADSFHVQQKDRKPVAVAFVLQGIAYRMEPAVAAIRGRLAEAGKKGVNAEAVAWAQLRALLELQLEAVENGLATAGAIFGGYAVTAGGRTVGEMIEDRAGELLPGETLLLTRGRE